jgi:hypothetical protein
MIKQIIINILSIIDSYHDFFKSDRVEYNKENIDKLLHYYIPLVLYPLYYFSNLSYEINK